jgi:hypothetical protein
MKLITALSSLVLLGTLSVLVANIVTEPEIELDLSDEEIHLYL